MEGDQTGDVHPNADPLGVPAGLGCHCLRLAQRDTHASFSRGDGLT